MIRFLQTKGAFQKYLIGGVLLVISGAMVITLVPGGLLSDTFGGVTRQGVIARVGDQEVTTQDVDTTARQMMKQQRYPEALMPFIKEQVVSQLVMRKAMVYEAERMGLRVTNDEVRNELKRSPIVFPNGQFIGEDAYERLVEQEMNMTAKQFEAGMREQLLMRKLAAIVTGSVSVSDADLKQEFTKRNTKVKFDYAVLTAEDVEKQVKPTDAELKAFYDKNKDTRYKDSIPEKRKAQYVVIDAANMPTQVTAAAIQGYYNQHQDQYRVPEQVTVSHILIKTPPPGPDGKVDQKSVDAARAKAQDVLAQLKKGANFAELAKKYSEDTGSAQNGGTIPEPIRRGMTVPEFEKVAFSLNPGQMSDIVQTSYGFHIIKVDAKQTAHVKPLDEVKGDIEKTLAGDRQRTEAQNLANNVQAAARTQGMDKAAAQFKLPLETTPFITRNDALPKIGAAPELMNAIFTAKPNDPAATQTTANGYVVYRVTEVQPPATPTFDQIRAQVETDFKRERASSLLGQKLQELADRARAQHNLKAAAKEVGATVKTSELVTIAQQVPDLGAMQGGPSVVFGMKQGEISSPVRTMRGGAVIALVEKQEPPESEFAAQKDTLSETILDQKRGQAFQLFAADLRTRLEKEGKIKMNKKESQKLGGQGGTPTSPGM